ncbi:hypothetical protein OH76DRAFT_991711 [Lentinus brumalis]|uniref:F-box domain-containing protein n=1 Tax=Lentinus brumalis TaxID=2498619 RepID=A0A371DQB6_9APHY|nr:hypothetical protein OH76DRAFT_991711 [Polyporus brumalis]
MVRGCTCCNEPSSVPGSIKIDDLPIELLIDIFRCVTPTERSDIRLTHVCRIWRSTLQRAPEFWAKFLTVPDLITQDNYVRDVGFWHTWVDRTRTQPLQLRLRGRDLDLLKTIAGHLLRLASLHAQWSMVYPREVQRRLLALGPLPALEELRLTCDLPAPISNFLDLEAAGLEGITPRADEYPQLRHLEVNPDFFIPSMVVPSLKTLVIYHGHVKFEVLMYALANCPTLESLHLDHAHFWDIRDTAPQVVLPHLRDLCLDYPDSPPTTVHGVFTHIQFPSITRLTALIGDCALVGVIPDAHPLPILRVLTRLVMQVYDATDDVPRTHTLSIKGYVDGEVRQDTPQLYTVNQRINWKHRGGWAFYTPISGITHSMGSPAVTELELCLLDEQLNMTHIDWTRLFEAFPALVSLEVRIASCAGLLKALRRQPRRPSRLVRLGLTCGNAPGVHHSLVLTLELRASLGHGLQRLEFRNPNGPFSSWHLARLREVVSEVVLVG